MQLSLLFVVVGGAAISTSGCSSHPVPAPVCTAEATVCFGPGSKESDIAAAFAVAKDGSTIGLASGVFDFTNQLALGTANHVSVVGAGMGHTVLNFRGQRAGEDALFAQSVSDLRFEGFTVMDTPGNAFKVLAVTGVTFRSLEILWTSDDGSTHGAYGLYPVQSSNVLIERCRVSGANDSGIYIGQSDNVVVRQNEAFGNVAGIEIENTFRADVYGNQAHDNTGGILVFDLPGLQQEGGHAIRVHDNSIVNNNLDNFAPAHDIVGLVPAGTGFFVMANHDVEVFGNTISGNKTAAAGIVSYAISQLTFTDATYYEWPQRIYVHDNSYQGNGTLPDARSQVGLLLNTGMGGYPAGHVPDVLWDGVVDPKLPAGPNPMQLCVKEAQASAICNMHVDKLDPNNPSLPSTIACDTKPFDCTLPAIDAVTFPGLAP